jgi:hypothetical protein
VRSAVRRLDRLEEMGLQNLVEPQGDSEAAAEGSPPEANSL